MTLSLRVAACVASVVAILGLALVEGGQLLEKLNADNARAIAEDDRSFCARFGMESGSLHYTECAAALADVRVRHDQRRADLFF